MVSDNSIKIFPEIQNCQKTIYNYYKKLKLIKIKGLLDIIPSFENILLIFDNQAISLKKLLKTLENIKPFENVSNLKKFNNYEYEIPICYDKKFGIDLNFLAKKFSINSKDIIDIHLSKKYKILMMGFIAGLPFMGNLDEKLSIPRRSNPRKKINAGSVGIAIRQCVIYPQNSPGGWHIIGSTPIKIFNKNAVEPIFFKTGDIIKFKKIDIKHYKYLKKEIQNNNFELPNKLLNY